jgi:hypothetical protein
VEGCAKARDYLILRDGETPGGFGGAGELIDWQQVLVGLLDCAVWWKLGAVDLADLREGRCGEEEYESSESEKSNGYLVRTRHRRAIKSIREAVREDD